MNRVDRSEQFIRDGNSILGDRPGEFRALQSVDLVEAGLTHEAFRPAGLRAWAGRSSNGFHVQGLIDAEGRTYISASIRDKHQTWEVLPENAADAFAHPFAYGCVLPL